jgi:hypothetical protein
MAKLYTEEHQIGIPVYLLTYALTCSVANATGTYEIHVYLIIYLPTHLSIRVHGVSHPFHLGLRLTFIEKGKVVLMLNYLSTKP